MGVLLSSCTFVVGVVEVVMVGVVVERVGVGVVVVGAWVGTGGGALLGLLNRVGESDCLMLVIWLDMRRVCCWLGNSDSEWLVRLSRPPDPVRSQAVWHRCKGKDAGCIDNRFTHVFRSWSELAITIAENLVRLERIENLNTSGLSFYQN